MTARAASRVLACVALALFALGVLATSAGAVPTAPASYNYDVSASVVVAPQNAASAGTTHLIHLRVSTRAAKPGPRTTPRPATSSISPRRAAKAGTDLAKYDADAILGRIAGGNPAKASELEDFAGSQGWARSQTATGPIKYTDENGVVRLTIKSGSARTPGSNFPHVEIRNAAGQRVDPYGNPLVRKSPGNHTPIIWDLP